MIALYRSPLETDKSYLPYTYTSPKPDCILRAKDRLFVFCNPIELNSAFNCSLGLPLTTCADGSLALSEEGRSRDSAQPDQVLTSTESMANLFVNRGIGTEGTSRNSNINNSNSSSSSAAESKESTPSVVVRQSILSASIKKSNVVTLQEKAMKELAMVAPTPKSAYSSPKVNTRKSMKSLAQNAKSVTTWKSASGGGASDVKTPAPMHPYIQNNNIQQSNPFSGGVGTISPIPVGATPAAAAGVGAVKDSPGTPFATMASGTSVGTATVAATATTAKFAGLAALASSTSSSTASSSNRIKIA